MRAFDAFIDLRSLSPDKVQEYIENNKIDLSVEKLFEDGVLHCFLDPVFNGEVLTEKNVNFIKQLLKCGANPNATGRQNIPPIQLIYQWKETAKNAKESLRWQVIGELLSAGANPNRLFLRESRSLLSMVLNDEVFNWFHITGCCKTPEKVRHFISDSWDPRQLDEDLAYIIELIHKHATKFKVDLNAVDFMDKGPLAWATYNGFIKAAEKLLELGADVNGEPVATEKSDGPKEDADAEVKKVKEQPKIPLVELIQNLSYPKFLADFRKPAIELLIQKGAKRPSDTILDSAPEWIKQAFNDRDILAKTPTFSPLRDLKAADAKLDAQTTTTDQEFKPTVSQQCTSPRPV